MGRVGKPSAGPMKPGSGIPTGPTNKLPIVKPQPGKPTGTQPGKPTGTQPGKPEGKQTGKLDGKQPGKPTGTQPGKPIGTQAGKPTGTPPGKLTGTQLGKTSSTTAAGKTPSTTPAGKLSLTQRYLPSNALTQIGGLTAPAGTSLGGAKILNDAKTKISQGQLGTLTQPEIDQLLNAAKTPAQKNAVAQALQEDWDRKHLLGGGVPPGGPGPVIIVDQPPVVVPGPGVLPGTADIPAPPSSVEPALPTWDRRVLKVENNTGETLTLYLQYCTLTDQNEWVWLPADPAKPLIFRNLAPGRRVFLKHNGWRINASQVRLWAVSASGRQWLSFKDENLVLVPEPYQAPDMETFVYPFNNQ